MLQFMGLQRVRHDLATEQQLMNQVFTLLLSVSKSCSTLCDPMDCSMPGFPGFQYILEFVKLTSTELMKLSNDCILCIYLAGPQLPQL